MKTCISCKKNLSLGNFHKDKTNRDRLRTRCKYCRRLLAQQYWLRVRNETTRNKRQEYDRLKKGILTKHGGKCIRCGFTDWRALQIDHVKGGGSKEREQQKRNWYSFYREVILDEAGLYQVLCANCNWIKRYENNEANSKRIG